jgi:7-cyano-7-deazaguanine reductase
MEGMNDKELSKRIQSVMNLEFDRKIRPIPYVGEVKEIVNYTTEELIARCPVTGYPDTYKLTIKFIPDKLIPELKSLKFYFMEYFDVPISHEHIIAKIAKDFDTAIKPLSRQFTLKVAVRGGIETEVQIGDNILTMAELIT